LSDTPPGRVTLRFLQAPISGTHKSTQNEITPTTHHLSGGASKSQRITTHRKVRRDHASETYHLMLAPLASHKGSRSTWHWLAISTAF